LDFEGILPGKLPSIKFDRRGAKKELKKGPKLQKNGLAERQGAT